MRIVDDFPIPIKVVSEDEKVAMEQAIKNSNLVLKMYHLAAKSKGFSGNRRLFFAELLRDPKKYGISRGDLDLFVKAKSMEWDFMCVYSGMILKIANSKCWRLDRSFSREDIYAVAIQGFLKAFCCFTKDGIRFSTYLHRCVSRHVKDFVAQQSHIQVPAEVFKSRSELRRMLAEGLTFDSAVEKMGLDKKGVRTIISSMKEVRSLTDEDNVVTETEPEFRLESEPEFDLESISSMSDDMKGLEKLVFDEFIVVGSQINLSAVSKRTVNPKTGRPYSRMALCYAWQKVRQKISEKYGKVA